MELQGVQGHASTVDDEQLLRAGQRSRIKVSSSNFVRFDRNLNTGGNTKDETEGAVAPNGVAP
jgi:predicted acyl esterase